MNLLNQIRSILTSKKKGIPKNKVFCAYPFVHLSTVPAGFVRPCCYFTRMLRDDNRKNFSITKNTVEEIWNSSDLREIRKKIFSGESVSYCAQCYKEDKLGKTSLRARSLKDWSKHPAFQNTLAKLEESDFRVDSPPKFLELKPGNLCNLKCRMCNQFDSSKVAAEIVELSKKYSDINPSRDSRIFHTGSYEMDFDISKMADWDKEEGFWAEVEKLIPYLEQISIAGGEPTLLKNVHGFLQRCVETGYAGNMHVLLATNFTLLNDNLLKLSSEFKFFEFIASIDGTEAVQEYIRYPSRWLTVKSNFEHAKAYMQPHKTKILINLTLQIYNILSFTKVLDWLEELDLQEPHFYHHPFYLNILCDPAYLSYNILPLAGRKLAIQRIDDYLYRSKILNKFPDLLDRFDLIRYELKKGPTPDYHARLAEFWEYNEILDEHRGQSLKNADPELYKIISAEVDRLALSEKRLLRRDVSRYSSKGG